MKPEGRLKISAAGSIQVPTRRNHHEECITKADGDGGIAPLEDKVVQHAVVTIFNKIMRWTSGVFRMALDRNEAQPQALDALALGIERKQVSWVLNPGILGFFKNVNHEGTLRFLKHRIADRCMLRLILRGPWRLSDA